MLKWLIRRRLDAFQRKFGYDVDYARDILAADPTALLRFARLDGLTRYRRDVPLEAYYAAKLIGTVHEDCGPCTQLVVAMALHDGVAPRVLAHVLDGDDAALDDDVRIAARFTRATLAHAPAADELRDAIVARWGPRALVSLAFAIAAARLYPTIKYALGHGKTCQRVLVAGEAIAPRVRSAAVLPAAG
jgi:alkylhydroperoxidase family enzyme